MKLFCLAYAGGTATTAYRKMKSRLYPGIDVVPVNIPGRVEKDASPPKTVDELIGRLAQQICSNSDEDWAILGHSYGAGLAFEITRRAEKGGNPATTMYPFPDDAPLRVIDRIIALLG